MLRDQSGRWVAHSLLGWATIWGLSLALGQTVGGIVGAGLGWALVFVGSGVSLATMLNKEGVEV